MRRPHLCLSLLTLLATAIASDAVTAGAVRAEQPLRGPATVIDGDTLVIAGRLLDLQGIEAPEIGRRCRLRDKDFDCGQISRSALLDLTAETEVICHVDASLTPGTARCLADDYDLSEGMVYTGWALADRDVGQHYLDLETGAQAAQRGFWRGEFLKPWALFKTGAE